MLGQDPGLAALAECPKCCLHLAVIERLKGDDHKTSAGRQKPWSLLEQRVQLPGLIVDRHSQSLKNPRGRVQFSGSGHARGHNLRQLRSVADRTRPNQCPGYFFR